jgi:hypothetical protein
VDIKFKKKTMMMSLTEQFYTVFDSFITGNIILLKLISSDINIQEGTPFH